MVSPTGTPNSVPKTWISQKKNELKSNSREKHPTFMESVSSDLDMCKFNLNYFN